MLTCCLRSLGVSDVRSHLTSPSISAFSRQDGRGHARRIPGTVNLSGPCQGDRGSRREVVSRGAGWALDPVHTKTRRSPRGRLVPRRCGQSAVAACPEAGIRTRLRRKRAFFVTFVASCEPVSPGGKRGRCQIAVGLQQPPKLRASA